MSFPDLSAGGNPDYFHIQISTPFAVGDVNVYLIRDEKNVLIDCGPKTKIAHQTLVNQLGEAGLKPGDIDEIWLTHGHPDHSGLAAMLRDRHGIRLLAHRGERGNFAKNSDRQLFGDFFKEAGVPGYLIHEMDMQRKWYEVYFDAMEMDGWIDDGDELSTGRHHFTAHHLPGHSPGHLGFTDENGHMFSGDVLLQRISTNAIISFDPDTGERLNTLRQLRQSMRTMASVTGMVFPGHGQPFDRAAETVQHHLESHEKRYLKILELLSRGPGSLFETAKKLFPEIERPELTFLCMSEVAGFVDRAIIEGFAQTEIINGHRVIIGNVPLSDIACR
ncbi:MAG: MBL fold metallo-hydrolase [Balneolaceae bacterium]|nr:MAG: MBL fold metallo-hydrolase [Balneolaceae bacterium]